MVVEAQVDTPHPDYESRAGEWKLMRDAARGETAIKDERELYLPKPSGFAQSGLEGERLYRAYMARAQFSEILTPTISGMVGVIHHREAKIEMPAPLERLWERSTRDGLPLEGLHRRITAELLTTGRYALLPDAPREGGDVYLAGYSAEALINWSDAEDFFVLDESTRQRDGFKWEKVGRWRVLELRDGIYTGQLYGGAEKLPIEGAYTPRTRGGRQLDFIPLVVIGATDLTVDPDEPPLIGVARAALAEYQLSADYRWQLFMSGQETLFVINAKAPSAVGAGVVVTLQGGDGSPPDAKYVGPAGTGIDAHKVAMADQREKAVAMGAKLFDDGRRAAESGEALKIRFASQTATLTSIALASAQGLEKALRHVALLEGLNPDDVTVEANLSFLNARMTAAEAETLVKVWQAGAISYETLYANLQRGDIASQERDADAEHELIDDEQFREPTPPEAGFLPGQARPGATPEE